MDIDVGFDNADLTVTRSEGQRGADGYVEGSTTTVLNCRADAQQGGRAFEQRAAYYEAGDVLVFARKSVQGVEVGDEATIDLDDGPMWTGTVAETILDDDALLIDFD